MNQKIKIGSGGALLTITDKQYKASGGEASIYVHNGQAYKLYHDPVNKMLSSNKMQELNAIGNSQVVVPKEIIYDAGNGKALGYTTTFIDNAEPLLKLFTRTFKDANNISYQMINDLVKQMQIVVTDVHKSKCLIVDLNELNVLAKIESNNIVPWFIDTDSYSTPSYKATAIMDSVRDRRVSVVDKNGVLHYNPDESSDWYSWAILSFCLYTNIHPYRGNHQNYKPKDKQKQMNDGISVFHPGVRTPPSVNNFKLIPPRHLDWFKRVFLNNERGVPPLPDSVIPLLVPTQMVTINGNDTLNVSEILSYADTITSVYQFMGIYYVTTKSHIYSNSKEIGSHKSKKVLVCCADDGSIILANQTGCKITFSVVNDFVPIGSTISNDMFSRNGAIYTMGNGKLIENSFISFNNKVLHKFNEIENVSTTTSKMYDGCVIQDLMGKKYLTIPFKLNNSFSKYIPQLDGFRVISAKSDKNVTVILAEKAGVYHRFIIIFDRKFADFKVREVKDVAYDEINFAVMDNGLCILLSSQTELELFSSVDQVEVINNPPFDSSMKLFTTSDGIFFINGTSIHQIKRK